MRKRIYSILLAIAMLATIIPITVLAENPPHTHDGYTAISNATELATLFTNGGKGYLTDNITATAGLTVAANVDLCLNDKVLNLDSKGNIAVNAGATFNLYDCGTTVRYYDRDTTTGLWMPNTTKTSGDYTTTGGIITGSTNSGVFVGGTFNMYGGTICGNSANDGGGVFVRENGGTFNMFGGTISGNKAQNCGGGVNNRGMFNMYGGVIEYNSATPGTEYTFWGGGGIAIYANGNGTLSGGEIRNNSSTVRGGGILILYGNDTGTKNVSLTGISVINNTATTGGGGIYFDNSNVTVTLGGNTKITDNTSNETKDNFHFDRGTIITIGTGDNAPKDGMSVGITMQTPPGQFTNTTATSSDEQYFTSDNASYFVSFNSGNYLELLSGTPVAQIGGTKYTTLNAAIKAAGVVEKATDTNATTIKLLANISNEGAFVIGDGEKLQNIILDLNGFTISDTTLSYSLFTIVGYSKLTIDDTSNEKTGTITAKGTTTKFLRGFDVASGTLVLNNGKICDFSLENQTTSWYGAGINIWSTGIFYMNGGEISNCIAHNGGGVYVDTSGNFVMNGGTITNCTAKVNGGGVKNNGTFVMKAGTIQGCKALSDKGQEGLGGAVYNYGNFTLSGGLIQDNTATRYGGAIHNCEPATFTMEAGSIISNKAEKGGGGINSDGNLTISGGTISENTANTENGGGVRLNATGKKFIMTGGTIADNKAKGHGGGVYSNGTSVTISGTTTSVTGNKAGSNGGTAYGGGIYIAANSFTMTGGTITGNNASTNAGGVHIGSDANNPTIGGSAQIIGNTKGSDSLDSNLNINAKKNVVIATGNDEPTNTMSIGITQGAGPSERDGGQFTTNGTANDVKYFSSDDPNYYVKFVPDGSYLKMVKGYTVTFDLQGYGTAIDPIKVDHGAKVTAPTNPSETGYTFDGWYKETACTNAWNFSTDTVTAATTLYAKWTANTTNVIFEKQSGTGGDDSVTATYDAELPSATMPTREGFIFNGYFDEAVGGTKYYNADGTSAKIWDKDIDEVQLFAQWEQQYTVTYDGNGATSGEVIDNNKYVSGDTFTVLSGDSLVREGYTFTTWNRAADGSDYEYAPGQVQGIYRNITLYAQWTINQYTITFNANGHGTAPKAVVLDYGSVVEKPDDLSATGYTFGGWYTDDTCKTAWNFDSDTITGDITLYAKWTEIPAPEPEPEPINYRITQGANSVWVIAAGESPTFKSNADFSKFVRVEVDGKVLPQKYYKAESGSTLITLTPEYTATLSVGKHTIEIVSTDGSAATVFYIEETIANTEGGFLSEATMSTAFVGMSIVGLSAVFFELKKKKVR